MRRPQNLEKSSTCCDTLLTAECIWFKCKDAEVAEVKQLEIQNDENSKWKLVKTRWNPKFGLSDLENDLLTSMTSEEA